MALIIRNKISTTTVRSFEKTEKIMKKNLIRLSRILIVCMMAACFIVPNFAETNAATGPQASAKINAKKGVYLRAKPSSSSKKIKKLKNNTKITIKEEVFVSKKSVKAKDRWYAVSVSGKNGYIRSDQVKSLKYSLTNKQTTEALNYRVGPDKSMKRKGTFKQGQVLSVVLSARINGSKTIWYKVKSGNTYYYVDRTYTGAVKKATASEATVKEEKEKDSGIVTNGVTYPVSIYEGDSFVLKGTITSNAKIQSVTAGVLDNSGKWIISESRTVDDEVFDIKSVDNDIKFGTLNVGTYCYRVVAVVNNKSYTACNYNFTVFKLNGPAVLAETAVKLAWPIGTAESKYLYNGGAAHPNYAKAMDAVFPNHNSWGKVTGVGASCDVFISTVCRYSGYDKNMPTGLSGQWKYLPTSKKWNQINYTYKESDLRSGDIITYKRSNGNGHICMYVKVNGKGCLIEAAYKDKYGRVNTSLKKVLSPASNVIELKVYRANS